MNQNNLDWFKTDIITPSVSDGEVLGFNKEWIDEDYSLDGICLCFIDDEGEYFILKWCGYHDEYHTKYTGDSEENLKSKQYEKINPPTHWRYKPETPTNFDNGNFKNLKEV